MEARRDYKQAINRREDMEAFQGQLPRPGSADGVLQEAEEEADGGWAPI